MEWLVPPVQSAVAASDEGEGDPPRGYPYSVCGVTDAGTLTREGNLQSEQHESILLRLVPLVQSDLLLLYSVVLHSCVPLIIKLERLAVKDFGRTVTCQQAHNFHLLT